MNSLEKSNKIKEILESKKAVDVSLLRVKEKTIIADYFVVATGTSSTHVKSLAEEVDANLKNLDIAPIGHEGKLSNNWVLLDYGDVIVHIFSQEARDFYSLESIWGHQTASKQ